MNHIQFKLILEKGSFFPEGVSNKWVLPITEPTILITPELIFQNRPDLQGLPLHGFNADIQYDSRATIIIAEFRYFTLANYRNTVTNLASLKVYEIGEFLRLNRMIVGRLDIENAHALVADCEVREIYLGIETDFHKKASSRMSLDLRGCQADRVRCCVPCFRCEIVESTVRHLAFERPDARLEDIHIWQNNSIQKITFSCHVERLRFQDSEISTLALSKKAFLQKLEIERCSVRDVAGIFAENIRSRDVIACRFIAQSYATIGDESNYFEWMYHLHSARLSTLPRLKRISMLILKYTCGFGFKVSRSITFALITVTLFAGCYFFLTLLGQPTIGLKLDQPLSSNLWSLAAHSMYFSIVSFATLGYGDIVGIDLTTKLLSAIEAVLGIYTMAIVVFALTKRYVKD